MFGCCGCPGKRGNRTSSEDIDEEADNGDEPKSEHKGAASITLPISNAKSDSTNKSSQSDPLPDEEKVLKVEVREEITQTSDQPVLDADGFGGVLPELGPRKSSLKKPKPRLSISADIQIIPGGLELEEREDGGQSPLSDEVFSGEALDPPRANLGVGLPFAVAMEFPRSPNLDVPQSPRGKTPTPHPQKRASMPAVLPRWLSEDDDEDVGLNEPPATPVAKDELALRRHRFFAELLAAAQAATEHRVHFDPLGPEITKESESSKELNNLLERLENITLRLEKAVPKFEEALEPLQKSILVTKSLEDLLDEHLTPVEKEQINGLISDKLISPDSSADVADLSDRDALPDLILDESPSDHPVFQPEDSLPLPDLPGQEESQDYPADTSADILTEAACPSSAIDSPSCNISEEGSPCRTLGESANRDCDQSDTDDFSSESPDTVVCDLSPKEAPAADFIAQLNMTNSQSTLNMSVQGFQAIIQGPLASYLQLSSQIGGDVAEHAKVVQKAFSAQLEYLVKASQLKKPSSAEEQQLLQPTSQWITQIQGYRESHRSSPLFNHLTAVSESIPALAWVTVSPAPSPFVKEMNDAGKFFTDRVLKEWKEKDKRHVEWVNAWVSTLTELQAFVKQHHTTGLVWSGTGGSAIPPPPSGPMPPPPPPLDLNIGEMNLGDNDRSALFAEINRGDDVTKGLKKVTSDMQTHKNPAMRTGPAPFKAPVAAPAQRNVPSSAVVDKPPKFARDGKKWLVEYQKGNQNLVIDGAEMNNVVYIFKCTESVVTVKGKINSIFLDSCKKTAVVFDSVVSSVEFVNCQSVQMQVLGTVPTISIDKTDGCQMYLNDKSLAVEIVSSKSSEMNVLVPKGNGDFTEYPIPEQFRTTVGKMGLTTSAVESTG